MREKHALVIIGAGPAGLAAAATAASQDINCVLIDEQPQPGGQIYRAVTTTPLTDPALLGADYWRGRELTDALKDKRIDYRPGHAVWQLTSGREIGVLADDSTYFIDADQVILATGAQERPCPIEGWTLPGVMGAGAAQILLKTSGLAPQAPVLAGSGPLLYLVAAQYIRMNVPIAALLETTPRGNYRQALKSLRGTPRSAHYLWKGWNLSREIQKAGVRHVRNVTALRAEGAGSLSHVFWKTAEDPGRWQVLSADTLLLHQGVVPNTRITRALGVDHDWDQRQMCWRPRKDVWGESSISGIRIAGDGGGIGGANAAELDGRICALGALGALGRMDAKACERHGVQLRRRLGRELTIRPFLDALYKPARDFRVPPDHVTVCRCEEVRAKQIRELTLAGCAGPNQMKAFTRCGMGPCQGQMCGLTVSGIMADVKDLPMDQVGYYRLRPPFKPLTLEQLANAGSYETADPQGAAPQA